MSYTMEQIRLAWLAAAEAEWGREYPPHVQRPRGVRDDDKGELGDRDVITGYFLACNWGFHLARDGGTYRERRDNPWCGIGLAAAGRNIGDHLEPGQCVPVALAPHIAEFIMPSTERPTLGKKWRASGHDEAREWMKSTSTVDYRVRFVDIRQGTGRDPADVLIPGMACTVVTREYGDGRDNFGGHWVMIRSYDNEAQVAHTVEFNGRGELGDGTRGEGVVHATRPLADFRRAWEFLPHHFETTMTR